MSESQGPRPRLRPTSISNLALITLIAGVVAWWGTEYNYGDLPPLPWGPLFTVSGVAVLEAIAAWFTWRRLPRRPAKGEAEPRAVAAGEPMDPLMVARLAVLAKASSVLGAIIAGVFAGMVTWLWPQRDRISAASDDVPVAALGICAGLLLIGAALWLEFACRIPPEDPQDSADGASDPKRRV